MGAFEAAVGREQGGRGGGRGRGGGVGVGGDAQLDECLKALLAAWWMWLKFGISEYAAQDTRASRCRAR
jgi:hypothetical protein